MILQALVAYYDRLAREGKVVPSGWTKQPIGWIIHVTQDGEARAWQSTYEKVKAKPVAQTFLAPMHTEAERVSGCAPYLLWDTAEYVLGLGCAGTADRLAAMARQKISADDTQLQGKVADFLKRLAKADPDKVKAKQRAFVKRIEAFGLPALAPILTFLRGDPLKSLAEADLATLLAFMEDKNPILSFRLVGDDVIVCARQDVRAAYDTLWSKVTQGDTLCLVSGERGEVTLTAPKIHLPGALPTGCGIVSFKEGKGFDSYGKKQGANAPIIKETSFRYTTAIQTLIDSPEHRIRVGDDTLLFWSSQPTPVEDALADLLGYHAEEDDDSGAIALKGILTAAQKGSLPGFEDKERFWLLLLQPVSARIAVRLWVEQTPTQTAEHLRDWFADLDVAKPPKEQGRPIPIYRLLASLSPQGDVKNLPPRLGGELLSAALRATPLPDSIAQAVLRRLKSLKSKDFTFVYAALLKAWLIRKPFTQTERKPTPMLDPDNDNPGYCLGRLFAVLEKTQQEALGNVNASIKDKFYATASADPAAVFGSLLRTATHHEGKLTEGRRINLERLKMEILGHLADIPAHLELADQARFALGYYHQRQDLFTKKEKPEAAPEAAPEQPITIQENLGI